MSQPNPSTSQSAADLVLQHYNAARGPGPRDNEAIETSRSETAGAGFLVSFDDDEAEEYVYQGFDPNKVYSMMINKATTPDELKGDVKILCLAFVMRGNNVDKMVKSMSDTGRVKIQQLVTKYNIRKNIKNHPDAITLARVALTFPPFAMKASIDLRNTYVKPIRSCLDKVHVLIRMPIFAAYMKASYANHAYWLCLASAVVMSSVIGDRDDTLGEVKRYVAAAQDARPFLEAATVEHMNGWNVNVPPTNWNFLSPNIMHVLNTMFDNRKVREVTAELEPILAQIVAPTGWTTFLSQSNNSNAEPVSEN
nr:TPA_asm: hypothetical protein [Psilotre Phenuili virus]